MTGRRTKDTPHNEPSAAPRSSGGYAAIETDRLRIESMVHRRPEYLGGMCRTVFLAWVIDEDVPYPVCVMTVHEASGNYVEWIEVMPMWRRRRIATEVVNAVSRVIGGLRIEGVTEAGKAFENALNVRDTERLDGPPVHAPVTRRLMLGRRVIFAVIGERSAVHFWVEPNWEDSEGSRGGVEFHERPEDGREPDHEDCWLLNGPCCHDGSSLHALERVIPMFHRCCEMGDGDYEPVWQEIESALGRNTSAVTPRKVSD